MLIDKVARLFHVPHFVLNHHLQLWWWRLRGASKSAALVQSTGGDYGEIGRLEREIVLRHGLKPDHFLIDIGCGPGRLAYALKDWRTLRYLGTDVVAASLGHAAQTCERTDWKFARVAGLAIPAEDESADFVVFFSVFTHLMHEESFVYLQEAKRVLRRGGRVVFSFLDFTVDKHWHIFEGNVRRASCRFKSLNVFIDRAALPVWARHLGLDLLAIEDDAIGQSICLMEKPK